MDDDMARLVELANTAQNMYLIALDGKRLSAEFWAAIDELNQLSKAVLDAEVRAQVERNEL